MARKSRASAAKSNAPQSTTFLIIGLLLGLVVPEFAQAVLTGPWLFAVGIFSAIAGAICIGVSIGLYLRKD